MDNEEGKGTEEWYLHSSVAGKSHNVWWHATRGTSIITSLPRPIPFPLIRDSKFQEGERERKRG